MSRVKLIAIGVGIVTAVVLLIGGVGMGVTYSFQNSAINLENNVKTAKANVNKEQRRRIDLFNNMVDAVESYNTYEGDTMAKIVEARSKASNGKVESASVLLSSVVEAYPELKSQDNYKNLMKEFSVTENRLADYEENYNNAVSSYDSYTRRFPASFFLGLTGYQPQHFERTEYHIDESKATNLFK